MFSGSGSLSRAVSKLGVSCHLFDNKFGPPGDVLLPEVEKRIIRLDADHNCIGVWMAMPCGTVSRARRGNERGGPKALRGEDARTLWGLPGLTGLDAICVRAANQLIRFVCRVADKCFAHDVCYYVESPLTSRLWKFPCIQRMWKRHTCSGPRFGFGQFGVKWRKATQILCFNNLVFARSGKRCVFQKGYECSATGQRHIQLTGVDKSSGQFLTNRAEAYPPRLCNLWAKCIQDICVTEYMAARNRSKSTYM